MTTDFAARATELDEADELAEYRHLFLEGTEDSSVAAYLDGNSLGRPLRASAERISAFVSQAWAGRLIRGWDEEWFELPITLGNRVGAACLGAAPGQCTIGDSTTVLLYKLARGGVALRPGRTEIVLDTDNFPTDRYILESIAADLGMTLRWIESDRRSGVTAADVAQLVSDKTALVVLSHVAYRSGFLLDAPAVAQSVHDAGAVLLLDLSHSVGSVPLELDAWGVDLAVGCTYKYLNGGPGSPAFAYVRGEHQSLFTQPIWGWMGRKDAFAMGQGYEPADGMRRVISGTPPILGMLAMQDSVALIEKVSMPTIRRKSVALTEFAIDMVDECLVPLGVELASPRSADDRGGHVSIDHPRFQDVTAALWIRGIIPDFRAPAGIRLGLSPLSTSFAEVQIGIDAIREELLR